MGEEMVEGIKRELPSILAGDSEKLVENAERLGKHLSRRLSTSQIRSIFGEVKQMREYEEHRLNLLRPKMAYTAGRHRKTVREIVDLQEVLDECIKRTSSEKEFENFKNFFEAILAYHRYYGGKV